jgi:hypothetical protein
MVQESRYSYYWYIITGNSRINYNKENMITNPADKIILELATVFLATSFSENPDNTLQRH